DGRAEVMVGAGSGGGPNVAVFDGRDGKPLSSFFPYEMSFTGGVRVAAIDRTDSGRANVITVHGPGGPPDIDTFNALTTAKIDSFFAYNPAFSGGLYVASTAH